MQWIVANWAVIASVLFGISEGLAMIPGIQANSVFQLIFNLLKSVAVKAPPAP